MEKNYPEFVRKEVIDLTDGDDHSDVWYMSGERSGYGVRCPECGNVFDVNEGHDIPGDALICPVCGREQKADDRKITAGGDYRNLKTATKFVNADGSWSLSIVSEIPCVYKRKDGKFGFRRTYERRRYVFSHNGHTYLKAPVNVNTGRRLNRKMNKAPMIDVTYQFTKHTAKGFGNLLEKGVFDERTALRNRFRGLSEHFLAIIQAYVEGYSVCDPEIYRVIGMEDDDMTALNKIAEKFKLPKSKKFRKLYVKRPLDMAEIWKNFRRCGLSDVNILWNIMDPVNKEYERRSRTIQREEDPWDAFGSHMSENEVLSYVETETINKTREKFARGPAESRRFMKKNFSKEAIGKMLQQYGIGYVQDIQSMCNDMLQMGATEELIKARCFRRNSIIKTHDSVQRLYQNLARMRRSMSDKEQIFSAYTRGDVGSFMFAFEVIAKDFNVKINYSEKAKKLEQQFGGIRFVLPKRTTDLEECGWKMHNCVDTYRVNAILHQDFIVFMKKDNAYVGCIEVMPDKSIRQAFGPCNRALAGEEAEAFNAWCKKLGLGGKEHYSAVYHEEVKYDSRMKTIVEEFVKLYQQEYDEWYQKSREMMAAIAA